MPGGSEIAIRRIEVDDLTLNRLCEWRMGMAVAKRELGRTGLQVTTLGYGAMELRGAPRARDITGGVRAPAFQGSEEAFAGFPQGR
jgi:hypothetical protein